MPQALIAVLVLLPAVLAYILRSNAALSFLALCGGFAVITLSGSDIEQLFGKTKITSLTSNDVDVFLLLAPLLITLLLTLRAVSTTWLRITQLVPALCAGALVAIIAGPMFSSAVNSDVAKLAVWKDLKNAQSYIVGAGLLSSLLLVWGGGFINAKSHRKKHK